MILSLETSTKNCSICLAEGEKIIAFKEDGSDKFTHAEKLHLFIEEVINEASLKYVDLKAVAVSEGPGSYTGLRIGVSSAKGMAYALKIPLIAVNTLEAMAHSIKDEESSSLFIPMIDARRMEVFCAGFSGHGTQRFPTRAEVLNENSFPEARSFDQVFYFGDGAEKCQEILTPRGFKYIESIQASAKGMVSLAAKKFANAEFVNTAYFEPFYLKDFVAGKKKKPAN
ncbi:MAG: tRNA (adenosine(37)-N6)-threonylcarbamoyltransferase complex dimerization subunit type 1 TsaB [Flavobacteriales bacterium]|nr:tRNA (adenosine(37)-N6)-threonylcarbamoyltransferase complex dimerization subunit type 1 TsaB [Flavobacteriales bacterium]